MKRLDHPAAPAQSIAPRCKLFTAQPHQIPPLAPLKTAHLGRPVQWRGDFPALGDSPNTTPHPANPRISPLTTPAIPPSGRFGPFFVTARRLRWAGAGIDDVGTFIKEAWIW